MGISVTSGAKVYIGTSETIVSPDDYLEIGEINDLGSFGRTYNKIEAHSLGTRGIRKYKGSYDDGALTLKLNRDSADTGQAAAIVARDNDNDYNFKVTLNDAAPNGLTNNTTITFKGKVMSYTVDGGGDDSVVGSTLVVEIKSGTIAEVAAS